MADQEDTGLLREIDEELRQDQLTAAAKTYGKYVIAAAVLLIAGIGGYKGWQTHERNNRMEATSSYLDATMLADEGDAAALDLLARLGTTAAGDIDVLADMRRAQYLAETGDVDGAISVYRRIVSDNSAPEEYRGLASLYLATHLLDTGETVDARSLAASMTDAGNPLQFAALEVTALADLEAGDTEAAKGSLNTIVESPDAPQGIRSRASVLLRTLPDGANGG
ncbi:MAG: tetratricopeptide repeat protein [Rhodospirillales bacterium]